MLDALGEFFDMLDPLGEFFDNLCLIVEVLRCPFYFLFIFPVHD